MAAKRKALWQILATQLLLVAMPIYGLAPEISALASTRGDWEPKTRLRVSSSALAEQPQAIERFHPEIASGDSFHAEGIGTIRALTDEQGTVTDRYTLEAFGTLLNHQGDDPNAYLFAGEPLDPNSGFYYNRARWLEPSVGRFLGVDPYLGSLLEPLSLHRYLYAGLEPVAHVDPSGRETLAGLLTGIAIRLALLAPIIFKASATVALIATAVYVLTSLAIAVDDLFFDSAHSESLYVLKDASREVFFLSYFLAEGAASVVALVNRPGSNRPVRTVSVSRSLYPQSARHIDEAVAAGKPVVLTLDRSNAALRRAEALRGVPRVPRMDRDEYPPAVALEGGCGASVRCIGISDNRGFGASFGNQIRGLPDGARVRVEVVD